ncbi:MAG: hypothetical protein NVS4B13_07070 [Candidatus Elarobacter sp.]
MQHHLRTGLARFIGTALAALFVVIALAVPAVALTTGSISGTITDAASKKSLGRIIVTAASPSGRGSATTDPNGFFNINNLPPDTYTVSIAGKGYDDVVIGGVTVVQDQNVRIDQALSPALRQIGRTSARSASNLVQPGQTADVYNISSQQLGAAAGNGGHRTLYDVIQTSPGVTSTGFAGRPRIRGSDVGDVAWEYDGIPINDRLTGLFTTNLSIVGTRNLEVYTGGFNAQYGNAAAGVINSVVKRGARPAFGAIRYTTQLGGLTEHDVQLEYGGATPNNKLSWYGALDWVNSDNQFAAGQFPGFSTIFANTGFSGDAGTIKNRDGVINLHYRPSDKDDVQFLWQTGNQRLPWDKALPRTVLGVGPCRGVVVQPGNPPKVVNPGVSDTGRPCIDTYTTVSGEVPTVRNDPTGLQFIGLTPDNANVWYHYSNLLKLQWNRVLSDKLFAQFRLAENFNQYVFDQPFDRPNFDGKYKHGDPFSLHDSPGNQDEYSDRRSHIYLGQLDLTYTSNANTTLYGGVAYERDHSHQQYVDKCGCDDAATGSPYNKDGSFPNLFLNIDYPLTLPSVYFGGKFSDHKLTAEPSVRYDAETYNIPTRPDMVNPATGAVTKSYAYGPYSVHAWSPRFGASWAFDPYSVLRGSWGTTTTFVPAAYVFNSSPNGVDDNNGRFISPYYPGANIAPQTNYNFDLAYSHSLKNGIDSYRIAPFYRHSLDKLALTKLYTYDAATGKTTLSGPAFFRKGIQNRATGFELGWNHQLRGDGLSWFLSGTYVNYWGSLTPGALAGGTPYGGITSNSGAAQFVALRNFLATGTLFRNPSQPPWSFAFTGDYNMKRFHAQPFLVYQVGAPYNVFGATTYKDPATGKTVTDRNVHFAGAYTYATLDLSYDLVRQGTRSASIGVNIRNLFDNRYGDVTPSVNGNYGTNKPDAVYGTALPNTLYYNAPDQQARLFQVYLQSKF